MLKTSLYLFCTYLSLASLAQTKEARVYYYSPDYVLVDARTIRGQAAYASFSFNDFDTFPQRKAVGLNVKAEFMLFSNLVNRHSSFVVHDALYTEMNMGKMQSTPFVYSHDEQEKAFAVMFRFGYDFYTGYRNKRIGLLAGARPRWMYSFIGDVSTAGSSLGAFLFNCPLAARIEVRPAFQNEFRIVLTAWQNIIDRTPARGMRIEVPFIPNKRFWLFAEYETITGPASFVFGNEPHQAVMKNINLGLRVGSLY